MAAKAESAEAELEEVVAAEAEPAEVELEEVPVDVVLEEAVTAEAELVVELEEAVAAVTEPADTELEGMEGTEAEPVTVEPEETGVVEACRSNYWPALSFGWVADKVRQLLDSTASKLTRGLKKFERVMASTPLALTYIAQGDCFMSKKTPFSCNRA